MSEIQEQIERIGNEVVKQTDLIVQIATMLANKFGLTVEAAPLYPFTDGSWNYTGNSGQTVDVSIEGNHVAVQFNGWVGNWFYVPLYEPSSIEDGSSASDVNNRPCLFTIPAGSTVKLDYKYISGNVDNASLDFFSTPGVAALNDLRVTDMSQDAVVTVTFDNDVAIGSMMVTDNIQSVYTVAVEFEIKMYVDGVRWI